MANSYPSSKAKSDIELMLQNLTTQANHLFDNLQIEKKNLISQGLTNKEASKSIIDDVKNEEGIYKTFINSQKKRIRHLEKTLVAKPTIHQGKANPNQIYAWVLSPTVKEHCSDCLFLSGQAPRTIKQWRLLGHGLPRETLTICNAGCRCMLSATIGGGTLQPKPTPPPVKPKIPKTKPTSTPTSLSPTSVPTKKQLVTKPHQPASKKLDFNDGKKVEDYTYKGDRIYNSYLRGLPNAHLSDQVIDFDDLAGSSRGKWKTKAALERTIDELDETLEKLPNFEGEVYRGERYVNWIKTEGGEAYSEYSPAKNLEAFNKYKDNDIITHQAFTSTSQSAVFAHNNFMGQGGIFFKIKSKTGKDVTPYSYFGNREQEILINRNKTFKVVKTAEDFEVNNKGLRSTVKYYIELEEL